MDFGSEIAEETEMTRIKNAGIGWRLNALALFAGVCSVWAQGTTTPVTGYAWSETTGWINFSPTHGGVTVRGDGVNGYLAGHAWSENVGWIKTGNDGGGPYGNSSASDWGVNVGESGAMSGYAWSETIGWINFGDINGPVTLDAATGEFSGDAWGENVGFVRFRNESCPYGVLALLAASGTVPTLSEWGLIALALTLGYAAHRRLAQISQSTAGHARLT